MCKNLMVIGIKGDKEKQEAANTFLIAATEKLTRTDNHGFGYSVMSESGISGERWLDPKHAWNARPALPKLDQQLTTEFKEVLKSDKKTYNAFGKFEGPKFAMFAHGRLATCEKTIENTHPFLSKDGGTALIHNGVISNQKSLDNNVTSTCDSECILNAYTTAGVAYDVDKIQEVADKLYGSYACGIMTKDKNGLAVIDLFRNDTNSLYLIKVKELDALVVCTNSTIVTETCNELDWKYGDAFPLADDTLVRIDAKSGKPLLSRKLKTHSYNYNNSRWSGHGYETG